MYHILVVDDQQAEIDAIEWLIKKHSLPLVLAQANNGEAALAYIKYNHVDILFTDIRMPFMDGLDLAKQAKAIVPYLKIIIYSAYGEFEYAKKAIELGTINYMLKPIEVDEFLAVMINVITFCEDEHRRMEREEQWLTYEKEKVLHDLLMGCDLDDYFWERVSFAGLNLKEKRLQMIIINVKEKLFDTYNSEVKMWIESSNDLEDVLYSNIDEYQSVILFVSDSYAKFEDVPKDRFSFGEEIKNWLMTRFEKQSFIIIGDHAVMPETLHNEYSQMEELIEYRFFMNGSFVWNKGGTLLSRNLADNSMDYILQPILKSIEQRKYDDLEQSLEFLIERLRASGNMSSLYVKLVFTSIIKTVYETYGKKDIPILMDDLERIADSESIGELKAMCLNIFRKLAKLDEPSEENNRKVIEEVMRLIQNEYGNDIGLDYLAGKVHLSSSYLSFLFKKIVGQSLGKYITAYRMERAKELMRDTTFKVVDVGNLVGYMNPSYFNLMFKQYFDMTPVQYRERGDRR